MHVSGPPLLRGEICMSMESAGEENPVWSFTSRMCTLAEVAQHEVAMLRAGGSEARKEV